MMPVRLLADEQFPAPVVNKLRALGYDVQTIRQLSVSKSGDGMTDEDVLTHAIHSGRVVLTENRSDFLALHKSRPGHKGIIASKTFDSVDYKRQADQIDQAIKKHRRLDSQYIRIPPLEDADISAPKRPKKKRGG